MGIYADSDEWADVLPIPQDDGGLNPLAAIAYTEDYSEAMSYLRAVMAKDEKSERVLELTVDIIKMNPAHYTVWLYRANVLLALQSDLHIELDWLNGISLKHLKNYQIWHHRHFLMSHIPTLPPTELPFLARMFAQDAKNYHVWSYRQWLVRHFALWDTELPYIDDLLRDDVRNNSAWNHRWFVVFCRNADPATYSIVKDEVPSKATATSTPAAAAAAGGGGGEKEGETTSSSSLEIDPEIIDREIAYAKSAIQLAPQNQSSWTYLRGILRRRASHPNSSSSDSDSGSNSKFLSPLKTFAEGFADLTREDEIRSSHALDFLADAYAEEEEVEGGKERAGRALELLATRFDPIRRNYWNYRRGLLGLGNVRA